MSGPGNERVVERRRKLIAIMADYCVTMGGEPFVEAAKKALTSTIPAVQGDLQALRAGDLPTPQSGEVEVTETQGKIADELEKSKDDESIDVVMTKLAAGVLRGKVTVPEAKQAHAILMGRRYFLAQMAEAKARAGANGQPRIVATLGKPAAPEGVFEGVES